VAGSLTAFIVILQWKFRQGLRGTRGERVDQRSAEVMYALGGTISLAIGWGLIGDRWLAFLPITFMAWGDNAAGLTRATIWRDKKASGIWPSIIMLSVCLAIATLTHPFWIGAVGAITATAVERYRPRFIRFIDDNLIIILSSLMVMTILTITLQ
jgi:dolichol kinase